MDSVAMCLPSQCESSSAVPDGVCPAGWTGPQVPKTSFERIAGRKKCGISVVEIDVARRDLRPEPPDRRISSLAPRPSLRWRPQMGRDLPKSCLHSSVFQAVSVFCAEAGKVKEWFRFEGQLSKMQMNPS